MRMTITVVCDVLGRENNGTTIAAMNLIRSLRAKGHEVRILCPDEDKAGQEGYYVVPRMGFGPLNGYVEKNGVCIARADRDTVHRALYGADEIHIMTPFFLGVAALREAERMSIPVTAGFHCQAENLTNHLFLMNSRWANNLTYRAFYRYFYRRVNAVHFPTQFIRQTFEEATGQTTNAYVISNGVNKSFVRREAKRPEELRDKFIILFTGRYSKEKSHNVLINAASRSKYADKIQLIFAGDGPQRQNLIDYSRDKLKNPPLLKFFSRQEMIDVINYADLYCHPAEIEIEAIACLEAISCGLTPVIADSKRSATRHFALGSENLFKMNDADDLAQKIDFWIEHPEAKAECSQRYLGYTKQFDQDYCMDQMELMIRETVRRHEHEIERKESSILYRRA